MISLNKNHKDTVLVILADFHSGGTTALFPNEYIEFQDGSNHTPNSDQRDIYNHFVKCGNAIRKARKGKKLIIVHVGDAIEGVHHNSQQIRPRSRAEQIELHINLMNELKQRVDFDEDNDELHYTIGTEVHTGSAENTIGKRLNAKKNEKGFFVSYDLRLKINGKKFWFTHNGPNRGRGSNRGNSIRNWLKHLFFDLVAENEDVPDYVITAHCHDPDWGDYIGRLNEKYHKIELLISASWQKKTRYAHGVAPLVINKVGLHYLTIASGGEVSTPEEMTIK